LRIRHLYACIWKEKRKNFKLLLKTAKETSLPAYNSFSQPKVWGNSNGWFATSYANVVPTLSVLTCVSCLHRDRLSLTCVKVVHHRYLPNRKVESLVACDFCTKNVEISEFEAYYAKCSKPRNAFEVLMSKSIIRSELCSTLSI